MNQQLSDLSGNQNNKLGNKWHLVQEIFSKRVEARNLSNLHSNDSELSDMETNYHDLGGIELTEVNLTGKISSCL